MQIAVGNTLPLKEAFNARLAEWLFSIMAFVFGMVLLLPRPIFDGPAWAAIQLVLEENTLGWACLAFGVGRMIILLLNGSYWPMYHLRAVTALLSAVLWLSLSVGFGSAGLPGTWLSAYPVYFVFEVINVFRAIGDAAANDRRLKAAKEQATRKTAVVAGEPANHDDAHPSA